jgi:hypothetical protein
VTAATGASAAAVAATAATGAASSAKVLLVSPKPNALTKASIESIFFILIPL